MSTGGSGRPAPFGDRLTRAVQRLRSPVCVGIDPELQRLPSFILAAARRQEGENERGAAAALLDFGRRLIDAVAGLVPVVKPQSAFFEVYGAPGVAAFWELVRYARSRDLLVIADAKRADIGSTMAAYTSAFFGHPEPASAWTDPDRRVDALTVNPYLGSDSLLPVIQRCRATGGGLFVLVKTSNPSARELQDQPLLSEETVAHQVAKLVDDLGGPLVGETGFSSVGAVVGATYPEDLASLRQWMPRAIFLVPGYGAQGGTAADVAAAFTDGGLGAIVNASRSVMYAFTSREAGPRELHDAVAGAAQEMTTALRAALSAGGRGPAEA